jgi:hypothetical protein
MFILKSTSWGDEPWFSKAIANVNTIEKIKQKETELQNLSKEEWEKEKKQPPRNGEWREMSTKEISEMLGPFPDYGWNFENSQQDSSFKKNPVSLNTDNKKGNFLWITVTFIFLFLLAVMLILDK